MRHQRSFTAYTHARIALCVLKSSLWFKSFKGPIFFEKLVKQKKYKNFRRPQFQNEYEQFKQLVEKCKEIEDRVRPYRNKEGHPVKMLNDVSLKIFKVDLNILKNGHEIPHFCDKDINALEALAKFVGVKMGDVLRICSPTLQTYSYLLSKVIFKQVSCCILID